MLFSQNNPSFCMVRICCQSMLTLLRQNTRPLDPASARKGSMRVYIWRCPRPHYTRRDLFAVHAVCDRAKVRSFTVFCLLALFMILVSTRSTARRTRRRVMSAAVAQIETSVFMRAQYIFVERDICFIRSEDCAFCGDMSRNRKSDWMRKWTTSF